MSEPIKENIANNFPFIIQRVILQTQANLMVDLVFVFIKCLYLLAAVVEIQWFKTCPEGKGCWEEKHIVYYHHFFELVISEPLQQCIRLVQYLMSVKYKSSSGLRRKGNVVVLLIILKQFLFSSCGFRPDITGDQFSLYSRLLSRMQKKSYFALTPPYVFCDNHILLIIKETNVTMLCHPNKCCGLVKIRILTKMFTCKCLFNHKHSSQSKLCS